MKSVPGGEHLLIISKKRTYGMSKFFFCFFIFFYSRLFSFDFPKLSFLFDLSNKRNHEIKAYEFQSQAYDSNTFKFLTALEKENDKWNNRRSTKDFFMFRETIKEVSQGLTSLWKKNDGDFSVEEITWLARLFFVYSKLHGKFFENIESNDFSEYYHVLHNYKDQLYTIEYIPFYKFSANNFMSFVFTLMDYDKSCFPSLLAKLHFHLDYSIADNRSKFSFQDLRAEGFKMNPEKMEKIEKILSDWRNMKSQWDQVKNIYFNKKIYPKL